MVESNSNGWLHAVVAVGAQRVDIELWQAGVVGKISVGSAHAPLLKREGNTLGVEVGCSAAHVPAAQSAFSHQQLHLSRGHPHDRRSGGNHHIRIAVCLVGRNRVGADANAVIVVGDRSIGERRLAKHGSTARVVVAVHKANDVGTNACVAAVVFIHNHAERVVSNSADGCVVGIAFKHTAVGWRHSCFAHLLCPSRVGINGTHAQAQLVGVGKLNPLGNVAFIHLVGSGGERFGDVWQQRLHSIVEFLHHSLVDSLLSVERCSERAVGTELGVRNWAISVGNAHDGCHLDDIAHREEHLVVGHCLELSEVAVDIRNDVLIEHAIPAVALVEVRKTVAETLVRLGKIARERTSNKRLGELIAVDIGRNHPALHAGESRTHQVAVALHFFAGYLVGVGVETKITIGACR